MNAGLLHPCPHLSPSPGPNRTHPDCVKAQRSRIRVVRSFTGPEGINSRHTPQKTVNV